MAGKLDWRKPQWEKKVAVSRVKFGTEVSGSEIDGKEEAEHGSWWAKKNQQKRSTKDSGKKKANTKAQAKGKAKAKTTTKTKTIKIAEAPKEKKGRITHGERLKRWREKTKLEVQSKPAQTGNPQLTASQILEANALLSEIRDRLVELSNNDAGLHFAFRRKIYKELMYDERSKPMVRRRLKQKKLKEQDGLCVVCSKPLSPTGNVLDRFEASKGYTAENTRLIHAECDRKIQEERNYT